MAEREGVGLILSEMEHYSTPRHFDPTIIARACGVAKILKSQCIVALENKYSSVRTHRLGLS
jgi:hypothetical protein